MSTGKVHAMVSISAALPIGIVVSIATNLTLGTGAILGCLSGVLLTPDLDQITLSKGEWALVRYIPVLGWQWMSLWDLYARLIPHRSFWSHAPVIGTVIRLLYLGCIASLIWPGRIAPLLGLPLVRGAVLGLAAVDTLHCIADILSTKRSHKK